MTWTNIGAYTAGQLIDATELNKLRTNAEYLLQRPYLRAKPSGGDYVTSSTAFVDVSATDFSLTLNIVSTRALVLFNGTVNAESSSPSSEEVFFDVTVDGVSQGSGTGGVASFNNGATGAIVIPVAFAFIVNALPVGAHTFRLRWRIVTGVGTPTATLYGRGGAKQSQPQFAVLEI